MEQQQQTKKLSVSESNFWLSLGQYLPEKRGSRMGSEEESEKINNWLAALLKTADIKGDKDKSKTKEGEKEEATKKRQSIFEEVTIIEEKIENESKIEEITFKEIPKRQVQRSFTNLIRRKSTCRKKKKNRAKYFGPLFEITFNLPRVSQQLERLMGSSVVRLTDRKIMLDLQKRIQEDYHDTLMKRISNRQSEEVKREFE
ncbi:hypothetical protein PVAND_005003 [Polypedilum vanderplanki]|uniref:Uncharacterized protein n=1 Tax=Polypedilum vanderplanki TaxID=319348 RepID=A0A9J6BZ92_POLVA|nr:hypothetical protein PVAND_005003 [Polypedilum vanderplanki]